MGWKQALAAFLGGLSPEFRFSLAASALVLLIGLSWLVVETISCDRSLRRWIRNSRRSAGKERPSDKKRLTSASAARSWPLGFATSNSNASEAMNWPAGSSASEKKPSLLGLP
jgi:hypothetical protein